MPLIARSSSSRFPWRPLVIAALVMVLGGLPPPTSAQPAVTTIVIHARKSAFVPNAITLKKGETVKLVIVSDDARHGLAVRGVGIRTEILPGRPTEIMVTPTQVGDFSGACSVYCGSGHRDMEFVVHVVE